MARGINKVILIGNLGQDPEVNPLPSGGTVANLSLATDESYKDKNTGQVVPKTEWHRVVFFNKLAEIVRDYVKKGSKVYVEGRLQTRKWTDKEGTERYTTEIVANELQMLDSKQDGQQSAPAQAAPVAQQAAPVAQQAAPVAQQAAPAAAPPVDEFDDDIPF